MQRTLRPHAGFTIVELLIVIVVVGILAVIAVSAVTGAQDRARTASATTAAASAAKKLSVYQAENTGYPNSLFDTGIDTKTVMYQYTRDNAVTPQTFCTTATVEGKSVYVNSAAPSKATVGACPGHAGAGTATNISENWTGTDGSAWPSNWVTDKTNVGSTYTDLSGGQGRLQAVMSGNYAKAMRTDMAASANQGMLVTLSMTPQAMYANGGINLRLASDFGDSNGIQNGVNASLNVTDGRIVNFNIYRFIGGQQYNMTYIDQMGTIPTLNSVRARFELQGNQYRLKLWDPAGAEPAGWNATITDNRTFQPGWPGVSMYSWSSMGFTALFDNMNVYPL
ncbi:prepilin-type N-terminal cleavage/methylation domain-containing protein [Candidatus Saccharibacteria bacterium]|nr:prepilin-type N-terminal cleavage/methylation domain-containing protein [Candidatus Saccharibacteria bacterium]